MQVLCPDNKKDGHKGRFFCPNNKIIFKKLKKYLTGKKKNTILVS